MRIELIDGEVLELSDQEARMHARQLRTKA